VTLLIDLWKAEREGDSLRSRFVRFDIAQALDLFGASASPARDLLLEALLSEKTPSGTQAYAARALGHLADDAAVIVPKLIELLGRKAASVGRVQNCQNACEALGRLGPKARVAAPHLRRLLDDEENEIVDAAAKALEKIQAK
jgi:HEAT repeat protein